MRGTGPSIFLITAFQTLTPLNADRPEDGVETNGTRCWGYYHSYHDAVEDLHKNNTDLHEDYYYFAVIEEMPEGVAHDSISRQFFKWDQDHYGFFEIEEPACVRTGKEMPQMSELKPCPFCGGKAELCSTGNKFTIEKFFSACCVCGVETPRIARTRGEAKAAWNRRTQPANEPLTLEYGFDITNADGSPIDYDALGQKYKDQLCYCDIDGFYIGEDGQLVLMDDCGSAVWVDRGDYHIEVRKPERSEG